MPITEVIEEDKEFDEAKTTYFFSEYIICRTNVKIMKSQMDKVLLDYATKVNPSLFGILHLDYFL